MIKEKQDFILFIGSHECGACITYKENLTPLLKDYQDLIIYYIDIANLSDLDHGKLQAQTHFTATPTTVFFEKGELDAQRTFSGSRNYDWLQERFKNLGYIE